jgi:hypothetical protein
MILKEPFNTYLARGKFMSPSSYKSAKSASEVWYKIENPISQDNPAFVFGHAVHTLMLEKHLFESQFVIDCAKDYPVQDTNKDGSISMRTSKNQEHRARLDMDCQMNGKELLTEAQYQQAKDMIEAYSKYNTIPISDILEPQGAMIEMSFYGKAVFSDKGIFERFGDIPDLDYKPNDNELLVKTRPDYIMPGVRYLDIKTCESAYPKFFANDCVNYGYDIQAAFVMDFCNFMLNANVETFFFLCMEKTKPYQSLPMLANSEMLETGRSKYQSRLEKIKAVANNGYLIYAQYPGDAHVTIPFPKYAVVNKDQTINW